VSDEQTTDSTDDDAQTPEVDAGKSEDPRISKANREAADYRRQLRTTQAELDKLRKQSMTEAEKTAAEAEQRGRTAALTEAGPRLARAEFRAAAAGVLDKATLDGFLEYADLAKFVGADGEPDTKAIDAAVKRLGGDRRSPDFDGGARQNAGKATDMNALIRRHAGMG
jgi:hypothetical protein